MAEPAEIPVTTPPLLIVAMPGEAEAHVPPVVASVSVVVPPMHSVVAPPIEATDDNALTVITAVDTAVPQVPETE